MFSAFLLMSLLLLLLADLLLPVSSAVCVPIVFAAAGVPALAETLAVSNVLYVPEWLQCCWHPCCFLQISLLLLASLPLLVTVLLIGIPVDARMGKTKKASQSLVSHLLEKLIFKPWMKEEKGIRHRVGGGLPTLPVLFLSTFQPSQRGFFRVQTSVWREREPEFEFLNF